MGKVLRLTIQVALAGLLFFTTACEKKITISKVILESTDSCDQGLKRYRDIVFDQSFIRVQKDIVYREANQYNDADPRKEPQMLDYYEPDRTRDTASLRPMIIYMHGGGSAAGDKSLEVNNCMDFARRGYVVLSINYRLTQIPNPTRKLVCEAYYRGIQDARFAIRHAKYVANEIRVDTNKIFFGGLSNGGVQTLHVAYLDDDEARALGSSLLDVDMLGSLDFKNGNVPFNTTGHITAGLCFSGWIMDIGWIKPGDPPMIFVHATSDTYSPITQGLDWVFGFFYVWGPRALKPRLDELGIPTAYYEYQDGPPVGTYQTGHATHGAVVINDLSTTLSKPGVDFVFKNLYYQYFDCRRF